MNVEQVKAIINSGQEVDDDDDVMLMRDTAEIDLGNLAVVDPTPVDKASFKKDKEFFLISHTRAAMQLLFQKLEELPSEEDKQGKYVELPEGTLVIPREKPLPKPKPMTRWEKFAQAKGIDKKKRSTMVLDETTEEYKPRHGYGRGGEDSSAPWLMLHSNGKGEDHDPYAARLESRMSQKAKQKMQEQRNLQEAKAAGHKAPLTVSGKLASEHQNKQKSEAKVELVGALSVAQRSTASMGKFDKKVEGEVEIKQKGKRRKLETSVHGNLGSEKGNSLKVLDKMIGSAGEASYKTDKAANLHQQILEKAIAEKHASKETRAGGLGKKRRSQVGKAKKFMKKKK